MYTKVPFLGAFALFFFAAVPAYSGVCDLPHKQDYKMCSGPNDKGCFTGKLDLKRNPDPNDAKAWPCVMKYRFGFQSLSGKGYQTERGDHTDGASIPGLLQWLVGDPFDEKFIAAAVVHDRYCDRNRKHRVYPWQFTHEMFHEGLSASGVGRKKAALMFYAVYTFGPRWTAKEQDPPHICVGNLTSFCQQMTVPGVLAAMSQITTDGESQQNTTDTNSGTVADYTATKTKSGKLLVYRRAIYDNPGAQKEIQDLEKLPQLNLDESKRDDKADILLMKQLSDQRHADEMILLSTKAK